MRSSTFSARRRSSRPRRASTRSGDAARRLERALDPTAPSPFTDVMRSAAQVADALWSDVEAAYLGPLD